MYLLKRKIYSTQKKKGEFEKVFKGSLQYILFLFHGVTLCIADYPLGYILQLNAHHVQGACGGVRPLVCHHITAPEEENIAGSISHQDGHHSTVELTGTVGRHHRRECMGRVLKLLMIVGILWRWIRSYYFFILRTKGEKSCFSCFILSFIDRMLLFTESLFWVIIKWVNKH